MERRGENTETEDAEDRVASHESFRLTGLEKSRDARRTQETLRVLMAAGGTGGHIFPALAVAEELVSRAGDNRREEASRSIVFIGTNRGLEARLIPAAGFALRTVAAAGLKGIGGWKRITNLMVLPRGAIQTARILREFKPHVVVGVGGYVSGPVMLEAALGNIPTLLIEPNAVPGFTNRVLAPLVRAAAIGFEAAAGYYGAKARVTGHPVRKAFYDVPASAHVPPFNILVIGGSQGSRAINDCVVKSAALLAAEDVPLRMVHQTGERDYNNVADEYRSRGISAEVYTFIDDIPAAFARADLIISRAGAATVAELMAAGKAAVLIPFPGATDHHQRENARALERAGAARLIEQQDLAPERLARELRELLSHPARLTQMEQSARAIAKPDAAKRIADWIEELGKKKL